MVISSDDWEDYDFLVDIYEECNSQARIDREFRKIPYEIAMRNRLIPKLNEELEEDLGKEEILQHMLDLGMGSLPAHLQNSLFLGFLLDTRGIFFEFLGFVLPVM